MSVAYMLVFTVHVQLALVVKDTLGTVICCLFNGAMFAIHVNLLNP